MIYRQRLFFLFYIIAATAFFVPLFFEMNFGLFHLLWVSIVILWSFVALYKWLLRKFRFYHSYLLIFSIIFAFLGLIRFVFWLYV